MNLDRLFFAQFAALRVFPFFLLGEYGCDLIVIVEVYLGDLLIGTFLHQVNLRLLVLTTKSQKFILYLLLKFLT